jgi:hypothetical protein
MAKSDETKKKLLVVTAVWGDWHIAKYLDLNLPTLLADGNFPALVEHCDITYLLYTSKADLSRLKAAPGLQALARMMKLDFRTIDAEALAEPLVAHHNIWNEAAAQAKALGSFIVLMPPDVAWSNGSFAHVGRKLREGKQAIFMTYLRVEGESFTAALMPYKDTQTGTIDVSGAQMVELSLRTLHALMPAYLRDSNQFPIHPEMMLWAIRGEGLLCRALAREMFVYDPGKLKLTFSHLLESRLEPELVHVVDDSDHLFGISLTPLDKDMDWYRFARKAAPAEIAEWWLEYDSWANDLVSAVNMRWHYAPISETKWRRKQRAAGLFLQRAALLREGHRLYRVARKVECNMAAQLLAIAVQTGVMQRAALGKGGAVVFFPVDAALGSQSAALTAFGGAGTQRELARLIRSHCIPGESAEPAKMLEDRLGSNTELKLAAADGSIIHISTQRGWLQINGRAVLGRPIRCGSHVVYLIDGLLPKGRSSKAGSKSPASVL